MQPAGRLTQHTANTRSSEISCELKTLLSQGLSLLCIHTWLLKSCYYRLISNSPSFIFGRDVNYREALCYLEPLRAQMDRSRTDQVLVILHFLSWETIYKMKASFSQTTRQVPWLSFPETWVFLCFAQENSGQTGANKSLYTAKVLWTNLHSH